MNNVLTVNCSDDLSRLFAILEYIAKEANMVHEYTSLKIEEYITDQPPCPIDTEFFAQLLKRNKILKPREAKTLPFLLSRLDLSSLPLLSDPEAGNYSVKAEYVRPDLMTLTLSPTPQKITPDDWIVLRNINKDNCISGLALLLLSLPLKVAIELTEEEYEVNQLMFSD